MSNKPLQGQTWGDLISERDQLRAELESARAEIEKLNKRIIAAWDAKDKETEQLELLRAEIGAFRSGQDKHTEYRAKQSKKITELTTLARELRDALVCNKTFHSLGGIDDCKPCLLKLKAAEVLGDEK